MHSRTNMRKFCFATTALFAFAVTSYATPLCNTGLKPNCSIVESQGLLDTHWTVSGPSASPVASPLGLLFSGTIVTSNVAWIGPDGVSQWIQPGEQPGQAPSDFLGGYYVYHLAFDAPSSPVAVQWASDNEGVAVFLNGAQIPGAPLPPFPNSFTHWTTGLVLSSFAAGVNTLDFEIRNQPGSNPSGLRVEFSGVPEPATYAMMGGGLLALGLYRRRHGRKPRSS